MKHIKRELKIERICEVCHKRFYVYKKIYEYNKKRFNREVARYCSKNCYYKSPARKPNLGKIGERSCSWKGGIIYERGYRLVIAPPNHPYGILKGNKKNKLIPYIREHRLIMEKHLGRYLKPEEIVHHIDGNIQNNNIKNLIIMSSQEHNRKHLNEYWERYHQDKCKQVGGKQWTKNE